MDTTTRLNPTPKPLKILLQELLTGEHGNTNVIDTEKLTITETTGKSIIDIITVENDLYFKVKCFHPSKPKVTQYFTLIEYLLFNENLDNELYHLDFAGTLDELKFNVTDEDEKEIIIEDKNISYTS